MKRLTLIALLIANSVFIFAQSKSFQTLHDHFNDGENVHSFGISGFLTRMALNMIMEDEEELKGMMNGIDHVRFIVIPKEEFKDQNLTVNGFRKVIANDSYEEVMSIHDKGDHINIFHRTEGNKKNRYFVLIEQPDEVVALELKGYIDPELFKNENNRITFNN